MQAVKVGWASQTFALSGCNDSRGKKPRSRRTKEERRTMVESFIKKYRSSNNGNFPSLNLTHKEAGGSFYTIREIVRDIIQENKVLGPGSLSLQSLTLDHCSEQQSLESLSLELCHHSLSSTSVHATDEKQKEVLSFSNEHQGMNEEAMATSSEMSDSKSFEMLKCDIEETFESHSNKGSVPQSINVKSAGYQEQILWSGRYVNIDRTNEECVETDTIKPLKQGQNDSLDENFVVKNPVGHSQTLSRTSSSDVSVARDFVTDMQPNSTNMEFSSVKRDATSESAVAVIPDVKLLNTTEANSISDHLQDQSSVCSRKCFSSPSFASLNFDPDQRSGETEGLGSSKVMKTIVSNNEQEVASVPVNLDSSRSSVDPANILTSGIFNEKTVANLNATTFSKMVDHPTSDVSDFKELPVLSSNDKRTGNLTANGEKAFGQASSPVKAEFNINGSDAGRPSEDANESSEMMESNPVLSFFKGIVAAFIKFWAE